MEYIQYHTEKFITNIYKLSMAVFFSSYFTGNIFSFYLIKYCSQVLLARQRLE